MIKVGQKVRIRRDLVSYFDYGKITFVSSMDKYLGKDVTIKEIDVDNFETFIIEGDRDKWNFTEAMIQKDIIFGR